MNKFLLYLFTLILLLQCKSEDKKKYEKYYKMDVSSKTDRSYSPKKIAKVPFLYNKIYDPFIFSDSLTKSVYKKGKFNKISIHVLDTTETSINLAQRKKKVDLFLGIPVIIKNTAIKNTNHLYLHRGCAIMIQEAKDKNGKWKSIEQATSEKIGNFYYKLKPKEYIYTKVPRYKGTFETTFRIKLMLDETSFIYSNEYKGKIQTWMIS